jgi:hypothetical protein
VEFCRVHRCQKPEIKTATYNIIGSKLEVPIRTGFNADPESQINASADSDPNPRDFSVYTFTFLLCLVSNLIFSFLKMNTNLR